ncbi:MAG TPA: phosphoglycerate dehydrogenase [Patescibacteria group bacterium]|nr:phosphoglycerate dehydrogenase [Patescibacteria group bacterium]
MQPARKVLISDEVSERALQRFNAEAGLIVDYRPGLPADELLKIIPGYAALVVRSQTKVTAGVIDKAELLQVIGRAGTGVDNVDLEAATRRGIVVMNVPGGNTVSAAEHTMAMLLSMARGIPAADRSMRAGKWERGRFVGSELEGKVLGVLGMGKVGREVAHRARAFGMETIGYDPFVSAEDIQRSQVTFVPLDQIFARADFITVHTPLTPETRHLVGDKELAACKPGVRLVNCARGGIVDEKALAGHLKTGHVAGAAFDVFEEEPPKDLPFRDLENVVLTPHLAASTTEAQEKVAVIIAEQICDYLRDGVARNAVNVTPMDPKVRERVAPFLALAEKLGRFQSQMVEGRLREVTVEYSGEIPTEAIAALTVAILKGYFERFLSGPVNAVNAAWIARERGIRLNEVRTTEPQDYMNLITAMFESDSKRQAIAGTVFGRNLPRIVRLDGFRFDAMPEGELLLVSNDDRPGIVGMVGSLLGFHQVNIAYMSLGRDRIGGQAIAVINIDSPLPEAVAEELRARPGILWVRTVRL